MKKPVLFLLFLLPIFLVAQTAPSVIEFKNGLWWTGEKFEPATFFVKEGHLFSKNPGVVSRSIDLTGQFVVPPLGDANSLSFDSPENLDLMVKNCLGEGIFYISQLTNSQAGRAAVSPKVNSANGPDVVFANGVLTCSNGEPSIDLEVRALRQQFPREWQKKLETARQNPLLFNDAYWFIDSEESLKINWPRILAMKPGFITISLRDTKNAVRKGGLTPEMAKKLVKKAHKADLRVFASIETADDFRAGLDAKVDVFATLPGHAWDGSGDDSRFRLTEKDFAKAKKRKVVVISTFAKTAMQTGNMNAQGRFQSDTARVRAVRNLHNYLLKNCFEKGIPVAAGSDEWGKTSRSELNYLFQNNLFSSVQLIRMFTENTARAIFSDRKIGRLENGFEASFLVLEADPTKNILNLRRILMAVKGGEILK